MTTTEENNNVLKKVFYRLCVVVILAVVATTTIVTYSGVLRTNEPPSSLRQQQGRQLQQLLDPRTVEMKLLEEKQHNNLNSQTIITSGVRSYTQNTIEETARHFKGQTVPRILVFDGETFQLFNLVHQSNTYAGVHNDRVVKAIPLLVGALKNNLPDRFQKNAPPFQLLYSDADSVESDCVPSHVHGLDEECHTDQFAPVLYFGSVPRDPTIYPNIRVFPTRAFVECLYDWKINGKADSCKAAWPEQLEYDSSSLSFHSLIPQIIWRGSNNAFLSDQAEFRQTNRISPMTQNQILFEYEKEEYNNTSSSAYERLVEFKKHRWEYLTPRWRGVILSVEEELQLQHEEELSSSLSSSNHKKLPWINVKFGPNLHQVYYELFQQQRGFPVRGDSMSSDVQARYKYLIDFGGGGGTTWRGTLTKLKMPGLLFHHVTPFMDWFHYKSNEYVLQDRVNCLFVNWDLSNLKEQYDWAESHPIEAQRIAEEGTKLAAYLFSSEYMSKLYDDLFVNYLQDTVAAYKEEDTNWETMKSRYEQNGFTLTQITTCDDSTCVTDNGSRPAMKHSTTTSTSS